MRTGIIDMWNSAVRERPEAAGGMASRQVISIKTAAAEAVQIPVKVVKREDRFPVRGEMQQQARCSYQDEKNEQARHQQSCRL